jgi:hypothetical protein
MDYLLHAPKLIIEIFIGTGTAIKESSGSYVNFVCFNGLSTERAGSSS